MVAGGRRHPPGFALANSRSGQAPDRFRSPRMAASRRLWSRLVARSLWRPRDMRSAGISPHHVGLKRIIFRGILPGNLSPRSGNADEQSLAQTGNACWRLGLMMAWILPASKLFHESRR